MLLKKTEILAERNPCTRTSLPPLDSLAPTNRPPEPEPAASQTLRGEKLCFPPPSARYDSLLVCRGPPVHRQTAEQRVTDTGYLLYELRHELLPPVTLALTTSSTARQSPLSPGFPKEYNVKHCSSKV